MAPKRKRTFSTSSPESNASTSSEIREPISPTRVHGQCQESMESYMTDLCPSPHHAFTWQLPGRTMKRYRDNRPSEAIIHERTINKLYEAQRRDPNAGPQSMDTPIGLDAAHSSAPQQSTLHSFWSLPIQRRHPALTTTHFEHVALAQKVQCEDCDSPLRPADAMDIDIDGQDMGHACHLCRKKVCDTCAINAEDRLCLHCAQFNGG